MGVSATENFSASLQEDAHKIFYFRLSFLATGLAFLVILLGAYTRLTDAGLGCPDWPGCYGNWIVNNPGNENPLINITKAWTEMIHRYLAGSLGMMILLLAVIPIRNRIKTRNKIEQSLPLFLPLILCILVVFQALLGMWTVTLRLLPLVVMAHLLGGFATLSLLWYLTLVVKTNICKRKSVYFLDSRSSLDKARDGNDDTLDYRENDSVLDSSFRGNESARTVIDSPRFKKSAVFSIIVLCTQLFLGGWTSANYAALACTKFPDCQPHLSVNYDLKNIKEAFRLTAAGPSKIGKPLDANALMIIHMAHRFNALITALVLGFFCYGLFVYSKNTALKNLSVILFSLLIIQILLGILNVLAHLPLGVAVLHNGVAALLLLTLITITFNTYTSSRKIL